MLVKFYIGSQERPLHNFDRYLMSIDRKADTLDRLFVSLTAQFTVSVLQSVHANNSIELNGLQLSL